MYKVRGLKRNSMFCPNRKGFFPLLYTKLTESLSREEMAEFSSLGGYEERLAFLWRQPRLSSEFDDNLFRLIKPMHGDKVSSHLLVLQLLLFCYVRCLINIGCPSRSRTGFG